MAEPRNVFSFVVKAAVALAVSAGALYWALRDVDLNYVWENATRTSGAMIALYLGIQVVIQIARIIRYSLLVRPPGATVPSMRAVSSAVNVGLPAAVFLPFRLGELVRPLMISRAGLALPSAFASVVVERVADGLFNVGLFFVVLRLLPESAHVDPALRTAALLPLVGFGGGLVFLATAYVARERVLGWTGALLSKISPVYAKKIVDLIGTFLDGLVALGTWKRFAAFLSLTVFYWGLNGFSTYLLCWSYGLDVPLIAGWFTICCVVFAVTVPAGPAFAGTLEAGFRFGLAPFGVTPSNTALVALVSHVLTLVTIAAYAAVGLQTAEAAQRSKGSGALSAQ